MTTKQATKKQQDWHPADVIAALKKAGWSLSRLSIANDYENRTSLQKALHRPYPKAERIIARAIGMEPAQIWPSRYSLRNKKNTPLSRVKPDREAA